jgi:hypothetical protein
MWIALGQSNKKPLSIAPFSYAHIGKWCSLSLLTSPSLSLGSAWKLLMENQLYCACAHTSWCYSDLYGLLHRDAELCKLKHEVPCSSLNLPYLPCFCIIDWLFNFSSA